MAFVTFQTFETFVTYVTVEAFDDALLQTTTYFSFSNCNNKKLTKNN